jgi:hypothetical protein
MQKLLDQFFLASVEVTRAIKESDNEDYEYWRLFRRQALYELIELLGSKTYDAILDDQDKRLKTEIAARRPCDSTN